MKSRASITVEVALFFAVSVLASGCGNLLINSYNKMSAKAASAIEKYDDPKLLGEALPNNLIMSEGYLGIAPENDDLLLGAAKNYGLYAMGFVEDVDREHAKKLYLRGKELGLKVLQKNSEFATAVDDGSPESLQRAVLTFEKKDIDALYITMSNWLSWVSLNPGDPEAMMDLPKIETLMQRILELDETYNYGAIHAAFGAYYGSASKAMGGQPEKSKQHFDKAFQFSKNNFLYYHVLYAKTYLVQIQDKKAFVEKLESVLSTPSGAVPEMTMANELAKIKAKKLLAAVGEYFL